MQLARGRPPTIGKSTRNGRITGDARNSRIAIYNDIPELPQAIIKNNEKEEEPERETLQTNELRLEIQQKSKIKKQKTAIEHLKEKARCQQKRNIKTNLSPIPETQSTSEL